MRREGRLFTEGYRKMKSKAVSGIMLTLLLVGILTLAFNIQPAKSDWTWTETIYIRADGSVEPDTAPISSVDNVTYTLTDNIVGDVPQLTSAIYVERDNIVVNGVGYTVQGTGFYGSKGISLSGRSNVTIKNFEIKSFYCGIYLSSSSDNYLSGNNITTNNKIGIWLSYSSSNILRDNTMADNTYNFRVEGWSLSDFVNDVDASNTVDGKPIYYWINMRDIAVPVDAGYVALVNCINITVQNPNFANNWQGALLAYTTNSSITKNTITNNYYGIYMWDSSNNSIAGNNITNSYRGIYLRYASNNNSLSGNTITNNYQIGICLDESCNNAVSGNTITANNRTGILLGDSSNNIISGNTITNNDWNGIYLSSSFNNTISGNTITDNRDGIVLGDYSSNNTISGNTITKNGRGIALGYSSNNTISGNTITNNEYGIYLAHSSNNTIYRNNFVGNTEQAYVASTNVWDDGYPSGGNYWSDHVCVGNPSDGSQPYIIDPDNIDRYPFQNPSGWLLPPPPPVGGKATPINLPISRLELLTPYIGLIMLLVASVATIVYVKKRKRNPESNS